jgi:hypothetical protein
MDLVSPCSLSSRPGNSPRGGAAAAADDGIGRREEEERRGRGRREGGCGWQQVRGEEGRKG